MRTGEGCEGSQIERGVSVADLRRLLRLDADTGRLYWRDRPRSDFARERDWLGFQNRLAGFEGFRTPQKDGYLTGRVLGKRFFAHRVVYALHHGHWPAGLIDHENGDRGDNRPGNLRSVDAAGNCRNRGSRASSASGVLGVSYYRPAGKWQAQIGDRGPESHLGYFESLADAVAARWDEEVRRGYHENHGNRDAWNAEDRMGP